jgi:hypothetical protein
MYKLNQNSISILARCFVILLLIAALEVTGSASAQTSGSLGKQQPVVDPKNQNQQESANIVAQAGSNLIQDPSFEASFGSNLYWNQYSTNFGTPICPSTASPPAGCGNGGGTAGPRTGSVWVWFGGTSLAEYGVVSQTLTIPAGCNAILQFYFWIGAAARGSDTSDYFAVSIDSGQPVFRADATQIHSYSTYKSVSIDLSAYADGGTHTIDFISSTSGQIVNFNLDDISLTMGTCPCGSLTLGSAAINSRTNSFNSQLESGQPANVNGSVIGGDTTGVFRPSNGLLYLKNANTTGFADVAINYGTAGDCPVAGDWDGNGTATIGIYRNGSFYLRNSNTIGFADLVFAFGKPGDQPIAGDWNGDGVDTIGVYRTTTGQFLLRNSNTAGPAEMSFYLGNVGDVGIAGDWNGDGIDTTGVFRPGNGVIFLKNTNSTGFADVALNYGLPGDLPVTGDWDGDGIDTIGIYRNGVFYLRNSNTIGFADIVFGLGNPGDMPIAGDWDGLP